MPILLRAGSNVNAQRSNDGFSALHVAAMVGRLEVANLLLQVVIMIIDVGNDDNNEDADDSSDSNLVFQAGADTSLEDNEGRTAGVFANFIKLNLFEKIFFPRHNAYP